MNRVVTVSFVNALLASKVKEIQALAASAKEAADNPYIGMDAVYASRELGERRAQLRLLDELGEVFSDE